jgi:hypothetical protein
VKTQLREEMAEKVWMRRPRRDAISQVSVMNDEYFKEQARRVRDMAEKADPFTKSVVKKPIWLPARC